MIDVKQQISAVQRTVGSRVLPAGTARVSTISQVYDTDIADLWDAVSNPERIRRWFLPISGDVTVGGQYQFEGNAGGTVESCDAPNSFAVTWEYGGEVSWVQVRLVPQGPDRTRFELEHVAHVDDERWAEYGPGATGVGWDMGLIGLFLHMCSGSTANDPAVVMPWLASPDGTLFITASSESWREANIAAGADEAAARAAAERTTAAYTGEQ